MDTKRMNFVYFLSDCIIMGLCYILTWYIVRKYFFVYVWTVETGNSFRIFYLISLDSHIFMRTCIVPFLSFKRC